MTASPMPSPSLIARVPVIPDEPTGPPIDGTPVTAEFDDGTFAMTLTADQERYRAGQLINVSATVTYLGPDDATIGRGSGSSLIGFGVASEDARIDIGPAFTSDCAPYEFVRGVPVEFPFSKSGGFSDGQPLALFYRSYFSSQELRLPAGTWTISAGGTIYIGDCGDELHEPAASLTLVIEP